MTITSDTVSEINPQEKCRKKHIFGYKSMKVTQSGSIWELLQKLNWTVFSSQISSVTCSSDESSCTMLPVERLSKIHTTDLFEVVPEPNIVAHITEQNSHFPWQQKTETQRKEENSHLKQLKSFNIHDRGDCGGSHKVWDIKPPNRH